MGTTPTQAEIILTALGRASAGIRVAMPGKVISYDAAAQTVEVEPQLDAVRPDGSADRLPVLPNVPVAFPRGGGFVMTFPLAKGDFVELVFQDFTLDKWRELGKVTTPDDLRAHGVMGAVAMPCSPYPTSGAFDADTDDLVIGTPGGTVVHIQPGSGEINLGSKVAADFVALAAKVKSELNSIRSAVNGHEHAYASPGGPAITTGGPSIPSVGDVKASKTRAD
jgi:hypothetical protein